MNAPRGVEWRAHEGWSTVGRGDGDGRRGLGRSWRSCARCPEEARGLQPPWNLARAHQVLWPPDNSHAFRNEDGLVIHKGTEGNLGNPSKDMSRFQLTNNSYFFLLSSPGFPEVEAGTASRLCDVSSLKDCSPVAQRTHPKAIPGIRKITSFSRIMIFQEYLVAHSVMNPLAMQKTQFKPWVRKMPWRRKWQPTPVFLPGKPMDRGAWWATVHRVAKNRIQLSN